VAPVVGWDVLATSPAPLVGTFHCYSENQISNNVAVFLGARRRLNHLHARIAVSEAAAWTGRRFYGGHYRIIPNGVDVAGSLAECCSRPRATPPIDLRLRSSGPGRRAQGLPILLRAFEALPRPRSRR
jgi:phosphatidylinositol alpha-mannosyltransferase